MVAHPKCSCTRASLKELAKVSEGLGHPVTTYVLFLRPEGVADDWSHSDLWSLAEAIPGVHVLEDRGGAEAEIFGAQTSGQVILYSPTGDLLFRGGITGSRGHEGDNLGESSLVSILRNGVAPEAQSSVFGCRLQAANARNQ